MRQSPQRKSAAAEGSILIDAIDVGFAGADGRLTTGELTLVACK